MLSGCLDKGGASAEEARAIREAVANASTLEEVERLNQLLRAGVVPGKATQGSSKNGNANGKSFLSIHSLYFVVDPVSFEM